MSLKLAHRLSAARPSTTLALGAKAAALKAAGKDVINLVVGEPDFDTPVFIKSAAIEAINQGFTKYTAVAGIVELRQAIRAKLKRDNQLEYQLTQVIVSTGLKQALFNLMFAVLNPGDEVIIPAPYWVSYPEMALLNEAVPIIVTGKLENDLKITAEELARAITPRTKMLILNSPSNPSGISYTRKDLADLAEVLKPHTNIIIATDDMYEKMYWGNEPFTNILNVAPELHERTVVLNGVSKTYAMTGWRIGYAAGPEKLIRAMELVQSQITSGANSIAQKAATAALNGLQDCVTEMMMAFKARYEFLCEQLSSVPGLTIPPATGTFYFFPYVQPLIDRLGLENDEKFSNFLLDELGLAVLPGYTCGTPGFIRISFATSRADLEETVKRFHKII